MPKMFAEISGLRPPKSIGLLNGSIGSAGNTDFPVINVETCGILYDRK